MNTSAAEVELQNLTKVKPKSKESRARYLARLVREVDKIDDDKWPELSEEAQTWVNDSVKAVKEEKEIPDFPGVNGKGNGAASGGDDDGDDEGEAPKSKKTKVAKTNAKPSSAKAKTEKAAEKTTGKSSDRKRDTKWVAKRLLIKKPGLKTEELYEKLKAQGYSPSSFSVATIRSDFRHTIKCLHEAGLCKEVEL
jgi:hypothetical protein